MFEVKKSKKFWKGFKDYILLIMIPALFLCDQRLSYNLSRLVVHNVYSGPNSLQVWQMPGESWPMVPSFVIFYILSYVASIVFPFLIYRFMGKKIFYEMCALTLLVEFLAFFWLIIFPTRLDDQYHKNAIEYCTDHPNIFTNILKNVVYVKDQPDNLAPSTHVYVAFIPFIVCLQPNSETKKHNYWMIASSGIAFILTSLSTLFVRQHYFIDVVSAVALTCTAYFFIKKFNSYKCIWKFNNAINLETRWMYWHKIYYKKNTNTKGKFKITSLTILITSGVILLFTFCVYFGIIALITGDCFEPLWKWHFEIPV